MQRLTDAIKHLIIINVILFVAPQLLKLDFTNILALHFPKNQHFGIWQYVTHMFMHADVAHIFFNMLFIWMFGSSLEKIWGLNKFLFFYLSAGVGAALIYTAINYFKFTITFNQLIDLGVSTTEIQNILNTGKFNSAINIGMNTMSNFYSTYNSPSFGASGALYGIFAASAIIFPNKEIFLLFFPMPLKNKYYMTILILSDLFLGIINRENDNIARFAHVGGAIVGGLIAWYWKKNQFRVR